MSFQTAFAAALPACACLALAGCSGGRDAERQDTASAAAPQVLRVVNRLNCPQREGGLHLVSAAADGRTCSYQGASGSRVSLRIVPLDGETAQSALAPIEAELRAQLPARRTQASDSGDHTSASGDAVNINLPGLNIDADDDGANIRIGGVHVNADPDRARVSLDPVSDTDDDDASSRQGAVIQRRSSQGDVVIDASEAGAEVRVSAPGRGVRMTYILASSEQGPGGDRLVAYEARGPAAGPLVVATLLSPGEHRSGPISAMKRLVRNNVGG